MGPEFVNVSLNFEMNGNESVIDTVNEAFYNPAQADTEPTADHVFNCKLYNYGSCNTHPFSLEKWGWAKLNNPVYMYSCLYCTLYLTGATLASVEVLLTLP